MLNVCEKSNQKVHCFTKTEVDLIEASLDLQRLCQERLRDTLLELNLT